MNKTQPNMLPLLQVIKKFNNSHCGQNNLFILIGVVQVRRLKSQIKFRFNSIKENINHCFFFAVKLNVEGKTIFPIFCRQLVERKETTSNCLGRRNVL